MIRARTRSQQRGSFKDEGYTLKLLVLADTLSKKESDNHVL
ncbi:hypothetical protein [Candidatus Regiella insecticola]|nr:hypothetical protein [Candidatus Regiella insecticola]